MKIFWLICILLMVGCGGRKADIIPDIVAHPIRADYNCFNPEFFFDEVMVEFEDSRGAKVSFTGTRVLMEHPFLEGYKCISDEFYNEIMVELENDINREQEGL